MQPKKILVFNPFGIGDVLFSMPLVRNLKESINPLAKIPLAMPVGEPLKGASPQEGSRDVSITYLCNKRVYPLLKNHPFLDKVLIFEKDEWKDTLKKSKFAFLKKAFSFLNEIKKEKFDVVFDLSLNSQYGFFLKMCGIRKRIGFNFKNRGRFLTDKIDLTSGYSEKHAARYHLELLKFLNIEPKDYKFDLFFSIESIKKAKQFFGEFGIKQEELIIAVCPGSGDSWRNTAYFKRWPQDNFLQLCQKLQNELKARIVLFGSEAEKELCDCICSGLNDTAVNLCGILELEIFCASLSLCNVVITNDGGPAHIAQALGKKTIILFGPVDEKVYGAYPLSDSCMVFSKHISCRPCYKAFKFSGCNIDRQCLREIGVEEVFLAAKKMAESV